MTIIRRPGPQFLLIVLVAGLSSARALALERNVAIRFVGNKVTRPSVMLQEMTIHVGDPVSRRKIAASRQAIMNLGLFRSVRTKLLPAPNGKILQVSVREKYYILPLPRLSRNADGDISYGGAVTLDNFLGLNQHVNLVYQRTIPNGLNTTTIHSWSLDYQYPRIVGTNYGVSVSGGSQRDEVTAGPAGVGQGIYRFDGRSLNVMVTKFLFGGPSAGWTGGLGAAWTDNFYQYVSGQPGLYQTARTVALTAALGYTDVQNLTYDRKGFAYGYNLEVGARAFGSDYGFVQHLLYVRSYLPVGDIPYQNLDMQLQIGLSSGLPQPVFFLGGSDTLRGFPRNSIYGRAFVLANIQFLRPIDGHPAWRGVLFTDIGNAYANDARVDLANMESDVGAGLRWRIRSFVNVELRLDVGYGINDHSHMIYAGTQDIF
ncbi:MAG: BamA/TamA family outer membrane protein [Acidiferrobacteraceae bacterium]